MEKKIDIKDLNIMYTLRKSTRARRMRLAVYCDGSIVVTAPSDLREGSAEKFLRGKAEWLFGKLRFFQQFEGSALSRLSDEDYKRYKKSAHAFAVSRVEHFNRIYGFRYNGINIKNQKTRWGSCSRKGNLNFNYKIVLLPKKVADYVIVHELCHLREFNHSKKFWNLVGKAIPEYSGIRNELRKGGLNFF